MPKAEFLDVWKKLLSRLDKKDPNDVEKVLSILLAAEDKLLTYNEVQYIIWTDFLCEINDLSLNAIERLCNWKKVLISVSGLLLLDVILKSGTWK